MATEESEATVATASSGEVKMNDNLIISFTRYVQGKGPVFVLHR